MPPFSLNTKPPLLSINRPTPRPNYRPTQIIPSTVPTRASNVAPTQQDLNMRYGGSYINPGPVTANSTPQMYQPNAVLGQEPKMPPPSIGTPALTPDRNIAPDPNVLPIGQSLINSSQSSSSQTASGGNTGLIGSFPTLMEYLANTSINGSDEVNKARADKLTFENAYSNIQNNIGSRPNPFGFMTGVGALEKNRYSQLEPAYTQNVTNALTAQQQKISGLTSAAGLAAPSALTPTQQPFYPVEGKFAGDQTQGERQLRASNLSSIDSLNQDYVRQQANLGGIKNLESNLNNFMGVSGVNPTTFPYVNQFINTVLQKGVGDPQYKTLQNYMSDLATRYSTYFGAGSQVTNQVRDVANSLINGNAKQVDVMSVLQSLGTQAGAVQQGTHDTLQQLVSNPGQLSTPPSGTVPQSGGVQAGGYSFHQNAQGQWVPN